MLENEVNYLDNTLNSLIENFKGQINSVNELTWNGNERVIEINCLIKSLKSNLKSREYYEHKKSSLSRNGVTQKQINLNRSTF